MCRRPCRIGVGNVGTDGLSAQVSEGCSRHVLWQGPWLLYLTDCTLQCPSNPITDHSISRTPVLQGIAPSICCAVLRRARLYGRPKRCARLHREAVGVPFFGLSVSTLRPTKCPDHEDRDPLSSDIGVGCTPRAFHFEDVQWGRGRGGSADLQPPD